MKNKINCVPLKEKKKALKKQLLLFQALVIFHNKSFGL